MGNGIIFSDTDTVFFSFTDTDSNTDTDTDIKLYKIARLFNMRLKLM